MTGSAGGIESPLINVVGDIAEVAAVAVVPLKREGRNQREVIQ